jgi:hypothetical protein
MTSASAALLVIAGTVSVGIALLQFVMYFGGPRIYRLCGTPERMIAFRLSRPVAALAVEVVLAAMFATFAAYAFSSAGLIRPLPWLRRGLIVTAVIYIARGMFVIPQLTWRKANWNDRDRLYSCIALVVGVAYSVSTYFQWETLY